MPRRPPKWRPNMRLRRGWRCCCGDRFGRVDGAPPLLLYVCNSLFRANDVEHGPVRIGQYGEPARSMSMAGMTSFPPSSCARATVPSVSATEKYTPQSDGISAGMSGDLRIMPPTDLPPTFHVARRGQRQAKSRRKTFWLWADRGSPYPPTKELRCRSARIPYFDLLGPFAAVRRYFTWAPSHGPQMRRLMVDGASPVGLHEPQSHQLAYGADGTTSRRTRRDPCPRRHRRRCPDRSGRCRQGDRSGRCREHHRSVDVDKLIDRVDVENVIDRVDVDKLVDRVDVDKIIDKVDVDKVIDRVDVDKVIDRVDVDKISAGRPQRHRPQVGHRRPGRADRAWVDHRTFDYRCAH